jgi:hypothetical protein
VVGPDAVDGGRVVVVVGAMLEVVVDAMLDVVVDEAGVSSPSTCTGADAHVRPSSGIV